MTIEERARQILLAWEDSTDDGIECFAKAMTEAVAAERDRCVRVVEQYDGEDCGKSTRARNNLVARILEGGYPHQERVQKVEGGR